MQSVRQVKVIAHRGASGYLPEHTLEAKAMAFAMGADYLEQDVVLTKDDVPIVLHDIHLDTVSDVAEKFPHRKRADGRYYAIDFTLAEVKLLNASERFHFRTGEAVFPKRFPVRQAAFQIPSLAEELELIRGLNQSTGKEVGIYPELKQPAFHHQAGKDISSIVIKTLAEHGYDREDSNCFLQCFDVTETKRLKTELKTDLKIIQLLSEKEWMSGTEQKSVREQQLSEIATYAKGIGPAINGVFRPAPRNEMPLPTELVAEAHAHGLLIHPWTYRRDSFPKLFRSFEEMHAATVAAAIDGIFSDFPDLSVHLLSSLSE